jgi:hypothetical protein
LQMEIGDLAKLSRRQCYCSEPVWKSVEKQQLV